MRYLFMIGCLVLLVGCSATTIVHKRDNTGAFIEVAKVHQTEKGAAEYIIETVNVTDKDGKVTTTKRETIRVDTDESGTWFSRNVMDPISSVLGLGSKLKPM